MSANLVVRFLTVAPASIAADDPLLFCDASGRLKMPPVAVVVTSRFVEAKDALAPAFA